MLRVLGDSDCGCVLMHLRGTPQTMGWSARAGVEDSPDVIKEIKASGPSVWRAQTAGVARETIALDSGFASAIAGRELGSGAARARTERLRVSYTFGHKS
jgi:dihydropteroate synthase